MLDLQSRMVVNRPSMAFAAIKTMLKGVGSETLIACLKIKTPRKASRRFVSINFSVSIPVMGADFDHPTTVISTTSTFKLMRLSLTGQVDQRLS